MLNGTRTTLGDCDLNIMHKSEHTNHQVTLHQVVIQPSSGAAGRAAPTIPAGESLELALDPPDASAANGAWHLTVRKAGVCFEEGRSSSLVALPGGEYTIVDDESDPALTAAEAAAAGALLRDIVESVPGHPAPAIQALPEAAARSAVWSWLAAAIGRDGRSQRTAEKLPALVAAAMESPAGWKHALVTHPRAPRVAPDARGDAAACAAASCEAGDVRLVIYHRALERRPGGNADIRVVRHAFGRVSSRAALARAARRGQEQVTATMYTNFDGNLERVDGGTREGVGDDVRARVLPALAALLRDGGGATSFECTIDDPARDGDAYDTEWSSVEVLLYEVSSGRLRARVHQHALRKNWYRGRGGWGAGPGARNPTGDTDVDDRPASAALAALLAAVDGALGLGRVEPFCDGETRGGRALRKSGKELLLPYLLEHEQTPLYLFDERELVVDAAS